MQYCMLGYISKCIQKQVAELKKKLKTSMNTVGNAQQYEYT